mmetsp:Transcript_37513/g.112007  ORF Transcript_37513/g.112007 Transcript_37513/m.112007 type:complete len:436 (-) Transcript_37513:150-1457(-)
MPSGTTTDTCFCISLCSNWCRYVSDRGIPSSPGRGRLPTSKESSVGSATSVPPVSASEELSMAEASASTSPSSAWSPPSPAGCGVPGSSGPSIAASVGSSSGSAAGSSRAAAPGPTWNTQRKLAGSSSSSSSSSFGDSFGWGSRSGSSEEQVAWECLDMLTSPRSWPSSGAIFSAIFWATPASGRESASSSSSGCCAEGLRALLRLWAASKAVASPVTASSSRQGRAPPHSGPLSPSPGVSAPCRTPASSAATLCWGSANWRKAVSSETMRRRAFVRRLCERNWLSMLCTICSWSCVVGESHCSTWPRSQGLSGSLATLDNGDPGSPGQRISRTRSMRWSSFRLVRASSRWSLRTMWLADRCHAEQWRQSPRARPRPRPTDLESPRLPPERLPSAAALKRRSQSDRISATLDVVDPVLELLPPPLLGTVDGVSVS